MASVRDCTRDRERQGEKRVCANLGAAIFRKMGEMGGEISESQTLKRRSPT